MTPAPSTAPNRESASRKKNLQTEQQRQLIAAQTEKLLAKSFPAELSRLVDSAVVHSYGHSGSELAKQCQIQNAAVAALRDEAARSADELAVAAMHVDDPQAFRQVCERLDGMKSNKITATRKTLQLCHSAVEVSEKVLDELRPLVPQLEEKAAVALNEVKQKLIEIGSGPESDPAYARNHVAAERRFDLHIRTQNEHVRKAFADAAQSRQELSAAEAQVRAKREALTAAEAFWQSLVVSTI